MSSQGVGDRFAVACVWHYLSVRRQNWFAKYKTSVALKHFGASAAQNIFCVRTFFFKVYGFLVEIHTFIDVLSLNARVLNQP